MPKPMGLKNFIAVDYTETGDDQQAYNAKKRKQDSGEGTTEALNVQQRLARKRSFMKNKAKIAIGRKKAARKVASMEKLKQRAQKQARNTLLKKITKGIPKDELSLSRRQDIEKKLDKMKPKIDKIAKKLLPQVRKSELEKKRGGGKSDD